MDQPVAREARAAGSKAQEYDQLCGDIVILGALGEVGALYSRSLAASGIAAQQVDRRAYPEGAATRRFLRADATDPDDVLRRAIAAAGCVIVCLPEDAALAAASRNLGAMSPGALWVDTLSVKSEICALLDRARHVEALSINPMFAPALGWQGNVVAAVEVAAGPRSAAMIRLLESWGARVERSSAADHDRSTAAIQVATHAAVLAFGAALRELGYEVEPGLRLATPPHRLMLALLSRMVNANPAVYSQIQRHHPHGEAVRQAMGRAIAAIAAAAQDSAEDPLPRWCEELRLLLAPEQAALRELSDRLIALAASGPREAEP